MQFILRSKEEKERQLLSWHFYYAWYPVRISPSEVAIFEWVLRRGVKKYDFDDFSYWKFEYKAANK